MNCDRKDLREASARILRNDPELAIHVRSLIKDTGHQVAASEIQETFYPSSLEGGLDAGAEVDSDLLLESIVQRVGRPALLVDNGTVSGDDPRLTEADFVVWKQRLFEAPVKRSLDAAIRAVGRIDVERNPDCAWVGTGWLVASNIIVTNRHVAAEFINNRNGVLMFRTGFPSGCMSASVDFGERYRCEGNSRFVVKDILYMANEDEPDMALLIIEETNGEKARLADPLRLAVDAVPRNAFVATIGYPAADSRVPDHALVVKFFGDIFDQKRLAPGQLLRQDSGLVFHDCSTLGGNSGSPVIHLETGAVVGLHFSGLFLRENRAVAAHVLADTLAKVRQVARGRLME